MVAASLAGEDWTALWSESLDLAASDGDIAAALARDAQAMLAATPEEVVAWQQRWLDLQTSEPGLGLGAGRPGGGRARRAGLLEGRHQLRPAARELSARASN
jgi:hypothetical protein